MRLNHVIHFLGSMVHNVGGRARWAHIALRRRKDYAQPLGEALRALLRLSNGGAHVGSQ